MLRDSKDQDDLLEAAVAVAPDFGGLLLVRPRTRTASFRSRPSLPCKPSGPCSCSSGLSAAGRARRVERWNRCRDFGPKTGSRGIPPSRVSHSQGGYVQRAAGNPIVKLNSLRLVPEGYEPPSLDEQRVHGPGELANLILHYREWEAGSGPRVLGPAPLSDAGLGNLLELAFYASTMPEEGRFFRFNLVSREASLPAAVFRQVWLDSPDCMRRLAPACTQQDCALRVFEESGKLWCDGLDDIGPMGHEVITGSPILGPLGAPPALHVRVKGPGHLVAIERGPGYELRGGRIRHVTPFTALDPVRRMLAEISDNLQGQFAQRLGVQVPAEAWTARFTVPWVIATVARIAVDARRGGAFVFLPGEGSDAASFGLHPKYATTSPDLGADIVSFWEECYGASQGTRHDGSTQAGRRWMASWARLLTHADTVGNLSCVDGCVVLNRRLQVCGFGSEIRITDEQLKNSPLNFKNFKTGGVWPDREFFDGIGGMRHKSAAALCKAHANVLVFVISQDGELRVFSSNTTSAYAFGPVDTHSPRS